MACSTWLGLGLPQSNGFLDVPRGFRVWGDLRAVGAFSALLPTSPWLTSKKRLAGRLWALRGGIAPPGRLCRLRHVAKRYGCFAFSAWPNRLLGEAMCRGRSPGEPREAWRGAAPAPWGFLSRPLWGPGVVLAAGVSRWACFWAGRLCSPARQVPRSWLFATWPQASRCCRRGGRREALGEPRRGALHPVRRFFRGDRVVHSPHGF